MSNLLPNAFKWESFGKDDFLKTVEAKVIIITRYVQSNETMTIRERSGSVVECLTRDRRAPGSSLTGVAALWSLSKTHLF